MRLCNDDILGCLTLLGEAEAESLNGKIAIAETIFNRMDQKIHSDGTVAGTILVPGQFECWAEPIRRNRMLRADSSEAIVQECMTAWHAAMAQTSDLARGATFYFNPLLANPSWSKTFIKVASIGHHDFYVPSKLSL